MLLGTFARRMSTQAASVDLVPMQLLVIYSSKLIIINPHALVGWLCNSYAVAELISKYNYAGSSFLD